MENTLPTSQDLGLPDEHGMRSVVYSEPARSIIVQSQGSKKCRNWYFRLFIRHVDETRYRPLVPEEEYVLLDHPVPCPLTKTLYYTKWLWNREGGDSLGIFAVDLDSGSVRMIIGRDFLSPGCWVSRLFGVSKDGGVVYCSVSEQGEVRADGTVILGKFHLVALDVKSGGVTKITEFRTPHF